MAKFTKLNIGDSVASGGGRVFKKLSTVTIPTEQLPQPYGVTIDGNTLTWGDYSALATNFDILVDGVVSANTTEQSFPLSYFGFSDGTYSISVVSKADGYLDSDPSEAVSYTVGGDSIVGTWVFNGHPSTEYMANWFSVEFTSNNENFIAMSDKRSQTSSIHDGNLKYFKTATSYVTVTNGGTEEWIEAYKTITILTEPTNAEFIAWLKANATKQ